MPEWLLPAVESEGPISAGEVLYRLTVALVFGGFVAVAYRLSHGREKSDSRTLVSTLVLLSVLIAMVSMVIGNSVARAFSLVGALSIVRFRTVVDDTRDTAFVIFAVIVGMAAGAGLLLVAVIGIPLVSAAAILLSRIGAVTSQGGAAECALNLRIALGRDPDLLLGSLFTRYFESSHITATGTAKQGSSLDVSYVVRLRPEASMTAILSDLSQTEGVQAAELRRQ